MATLAEETPYAAVVMNNQLSFVCWRCFIRKDNKPLSRCSKCRVAHYCGSQCQKGDWNDHKYECIFLMNCAPRIPTSMARLISRIAMKLSRGENGGAFNGRVFSDLMDHKESIQGDPERCEFFICVSHVLYDFMGVDFIPRPSDLISIFGKIVTNCFCITDYLLNTLGMGLYVGLSVHNHSCFPDAYVIFNGANATLRSPNSTFKYDKQITISYTNTMLSNVERRRQLKKQYYFECTCKICNDKERACFSFISLITILIFHSYSDYLITISLSQDKWSSSVIASCCQDGICLLDPNESILVCYRCGSLSSMAVSEAISYNQELELILEKTENDEKSDIMTNSSQQLQESVRVYEKFSKVSSQKL
uniref:MYND-type domain-containing protein n=1 Tax=Heterorhabditis bacteriophora TaxID=37862 RepID=A0A1I7WG49_HETBA